MEPASLRELMFLASLDSSNDYPENLTRRPEFEKVWLDFTRDFKIKLDKVTVSGSFSLYHTRPPVFIYDYRDGNDRTENPVVDLKGLQATLKLPNRNGNAGQGQISTVVERAKGAKIDLYKLLPEEIDLSEDPDVRLIFLEASTISGLPLRVTKDMLLQILTYHEVSAAYLSFLSYFDCTLLTSESDALFGGFRYLRRLDSSSPSQLPPCLGRSGQDFQLAFELKAVFLPIDNRRPESIARAKRCYKRHSSEYSWSRFLCWKIPRKEKPELDFEVSDKLGQYTITQAAVYHHFDLENGKAFWIITGPNEQSLNDSGMSSDSFITKVRRLRSYDQYVDVRTADLGQRLESALDMILWISQWSLSEFSWYIDLLDQAVRDLTSPILVFNKTRKRAITENTLTQLNRYLEKVNSCVISLNANIRVCDNLKIFYQEQLLKDVKNIRSMAWVSKEKKKIMEFTRKNGLICAALRNLSRRATQLVQVGKQRETVIKNFMHVRNEESMKSDSNRMRVITIFTFILFPLTLTSTFFAAGIVKFDDPDNLVGKWSRGGGIWFVSLATVLTSLCLFLMWLVSWSLRPPTSQDSEDDCDEDHWDLGGRPNSLLGVWYSLTDLFVGFTAWIVDKRITYFASCLRYCCPPSGGSSLGDDLDGYEGSSQTERGLKKD